MCKQGGPADMGGMSTLATGSLGCGRAPAVEPQAEGRVFAQRRAGAGSLPPAVVVVVFVSPRSTSSCSTRHRKAIGR